MIFKNGTVLLHDSAVKTDIEVRDGSIVNILENITGSTDDVVDAKGKYIIPGGIDPHTHFNINVGIAQSADDFRSGSVAALHGGTTCIVDHPGFGPQGCSLYHQINLYRKYAQKSLIDFSFHGVVQHIDDQTFLEMQELKSQGINSFKIYLTYGFKLDDEAVIKIFNYAKLLDLVICVHAENHFGIEYLRKCYNDSNQRSPMMHAKSRTGILESEAVFGLLSLAEITGFENLYLVHVSAKESYDVIRYFKTRGLRFFVETCPQYLFLDDSAYLKKDGFKYILCPPLRDKDNAKYILEAVHDGIIDTIGTDHCSFTLDQKKIGGTDFFQCPNGLPGVQEKTPLLFTEYLKGNLSVKEFISLNSSKSAEIFKLPNKGLIAVGMDADLVIMSPQKSTFTDIYSAANYTCYEDFELAAIVQDVFVRGEQIIKNGELIKERQGHFAPKMTGVQNV